MKQKSIAITAVIAAIMLTTVFTTTPPFSMNDSEGQSLPLPSCPVGYERNPLGTCVPIVAPVPDNGDGDSSNIEIKNIEKSVASGESTNDFCSNNLIDSTNGQCGPSG